ncbi:alpha,alpha-trehalase TreF [Niveispirillum irakense]|uniref:alpha,alpha-trehalase TreF n=1 Tax=Niveispirillum irakense TaxID=34011 RepID=UPI000402155D|nr:alpha,alpha-trehalase TreF [Niveispirillum irakense]
MKRAIPFLAAALFLCGFDHAPPSSPADLYGALFVAVQEQRLFTDGKTFVDAVPKRPAAAIMADYHRVKPQDTQALRAFVETNFALPDAVATEAPPPHEPRALLAHIAALWPQLTRSPLDPPAGSSALGLPEPYVVPGGRFREIYYWDSYFTMLGLIADGRQDLVDSMLTGFESLIERYGHIPNGTRTYYLSRSQPPFFGLMLDLAGPGDAARDARHLAALKREYDYWMDRSGCAEIIIACRRTLRMPDGSVLNRYWDDRDSPRDESYAEDVETAAQSDRPAGIVYRDLRAAAESGWDFSARWLAHPGHLHTIRTTRIVPVDLNSLIWTMEKAIARRCQALADSACAADFTSKADARAQAVHQYLWDGRENRFQDWDMDSGQGTGFLSAAALYPLFVGLATPEQAASMAKVTADHLLAPGGLRTSLRFTHQQWDAPNGWPPLQWVAIDGLARYGHEGLAKDIAARWVGTVDRAYRETGRLLEKYNVEERLPGGGGEYPLQDGFGWTNGVTRALIARYPDLNPDR